MNFDEDVFHTALVAGEPALPAGKVPDPFIDVEDVAEMFVLMARAGIASTTDELSPLLGRPPRTFEGHVARAASTGAWDR